MILVKPSFEIWTPISHTIILRLLERAGRTCYKSESKENWEETKKFIKNIISRGHESVIEHFNITVRIICDRGVTHELVRHRLASYSQESTRYCNYKSGVVFVIPPWVDIKPGEYKYEASLHTGDIPSVIWGRAMWDAEEDYIKLVNTHHWSPQQARSVLPNSLKTEIIMTCNLREWRHFFKLRTSKAAHPQMREVAVPMLQEFRQLIPVIFEDIEVE